MKDERSWFRSRGMLTAPFVIALAVTVSGCQTGSKAVIVDDPGLFGDPDVRVVPNRLGRPGGIGDPDLVGVGDPVERKVKREVHQEVRQEGRQEVRHEVNRARRRKFSRGL